MKEKLFSEFERQTEESWASKIETDLKGKPTDTVLSKTEDGIEIKPNYFENSGDSTTIFRETSNWKIGFELTKESNTEFLEQLRGGANLAFIHVNDITNLDDLLKDVMSEIIDLKIIYQGSNLEQLKMNLDSNIQILVDPFQNSQDASEHKDILIAADIYKNSGATSAQSMAFTASQFTETLTANPDYVAIKVAIGLDYFEEIASLRGLRAILGQIKAEFGWEGTFEIFPVPSAYYLSCKEVNNNILRITTMCMSGILGGADGFITNSFNMKAEEFGNRISRNIQLLLQEESYLNKVCNIFED